MIKFYHLILLISFATISQSSSLENYEKEELEKLREYESVQKETLNKDEKKLKDHIVKSNKSFENWKLIQDKEYHDFKIEILKSWGEFITPTNKKWVEYSADKKSVAHVDFEKGKVKVEVLIDQKDSPEEIDNNLTNAINRVIESKASISTIPVESDRKLLQEPVLNNQISDFNNQILNNSNKMAFVDSLTKSAVLIEKKGRKKVVVKFDLIPNHLKKRIEPYLPIIKKYCHKYSLSMARVLATIEVESSFNPAALSHTGAIGLMQLMPQYGGEEAFQFVMNTDEKPNYEYLYAPENNIKLGCAYIYLLKDKYFKDIQDKKSLLYCSISAYNTGPKNTAKAFVSSGNIKDAIQIINTKKSYYWVYETLLLKLPYKETRIYLKKIVEKMSNY